MSTQYPVLDNRPINKWKVIELKEELKRRQLTTKGLKDDLVKRLHESILSESKAFEYGTTNTVGYNPELLVKHVVPESNPNDEEMAGDTWNHDIYEPVKVDEVVSVVTNDNSRFEMDEGKVEEEETVANINDPIEGEPVSDMNKPVKVDEKVVAGLDVGDVPYDLDQEKPQEEAMGGIDSVEMIMEEPAFEVSIETSIKNNEIVASEKNATDVPYDLDQEKSQEEAMGGIDSVEMIMEEPAFEVSIETSIKNNEIVASENNATDVPYDLDQEKSQEEAMGGIDSVEMIVEEPVFGVSIETSIKNNEIVASEKNATDVPYDLDQEKSQEEVMGGIDSVEMIVEEPVFEVSIETSIKNNEIVASEKNATDVPYDLDQEKSQEEALSGIDSVEMIVEKPVFEVSIETSIKNIAIVASEKNPTDAVNVDSDPSHIENEMVGEPAVLEASVESSVMVNDCVVTQMPMGEKALQSDETKMENVGSSPLQIDAECNTSDLNNQVFEVSPNLGFQVKSESISTDTVSVYPNNELKINLNADNVDLELNVSRPEMVQPSSSECPPIHVDLHTMDDNKPNGNLGSVEEADENKSTPLDFTNTYDTADGGSSVVLKLDHNLDDDCTGEDVLENKPIDLKHNLSNVRDKIELMDEPIAKSGSPDGTARADYFADKVETFSAANEEKSFQDDFKSTPMDLSEKSYMADEEPLEKINLDHSSGDDSMEEDMLEKKQIDSNNNSTEVAEKIELTEVPDVKMGDTADAVGPDLSADKLESFSDKDGLSAPEKRKFQDEAVVGNKEPPKRQRRWNSESLNIPEMQSSNLLLSAAHKDLSQTTMLNQNLRGSDSTLNGDSREEHVVPPSPKPPTDSLRIDNFLRPFTLKAVQELLARTGKVCSFWMDQIKTHCYVTYSSAEEAIETRNTLYNLQWPPNGGRLLVAKFVDPQEVKLRTEVPPPSASMPVGSVPTVPESRALVQPPSSTSQRGLKQNTLPQPPTVSDPLTTRERSPRPPTPPPPEVDPPMLTLDDLFRRTRATPRIYYLPLTDEQVATKIAGHRGKRQ